MSMRDELQHSPSETSVQPDQIIGRAVARVPWLGYVKIWFVDLLVLTGLDSVAQIF